jgi:lipopolysaccharide/colanic/teichoic acid biosynthesis glycosyltransferase
MKKPPECRLDDANVINLPIFFERETDRVQFEPVNPDYRASPGAFHIGTPKKMGKRLFDLGVGSLLLLTTLPVLSLTALVLWLESGRPILHRQQRTGAQGHTFSLLKFRSTRADTKPVTQAPWVCENDAHFTRVGQVIRRLGLDELPKLINVMKGDMSLVRLQPESPKFVQGLSTQIDHRSFRHALKAETRGGPR